MAVKRRQLEVASRRVVQDAKLAIRDVYDAIVELVTNSDDRYQILGTPGRVEIELGRIGGRVSGMEEGKAVRGTNSRGAKDIAALGKVTFESIAGDGRMHTCRIFPNMEYEADNSRKVTPEVRKRLGIGEGTGTVVTIKIEPSHRIPKIDTLVPNVARLVRLREIVWQKQTTLVARGLKKGKDREVSLHRLYERALTLLRPLVEEERTREQRERARTVESRKTRKRLDALERAANQFMEDFSDEDMSRDPKGKETGSRFQTQGYSLSPQYAQVVREQSFKCWLTVRSKAFPEIGEGESVEVECLTDEIRAERPTVPLEAVEAQEGALRATWSVKALEATPATGLEARVGPIRAESTIAVLATEAERYTHVDELQFERKSYRIRGGSRRSIRLLAPLALARSAGREFDLELSSDDFRVSGPRKLVLSATLGIAMCKLSVAVLDDDAAPTRVTARLGKHEAETELRAAPATGAGIVIKLEDVDHGALRYRWNQNVLEIGARHPSLERYLGPKSEQYPGQDELHFQVLLAEVVAEALCARRLQANIESNPRDFEGMAWDDYYRHFARMMSEFLPKAHGLMAPGV